MARKEYDDWKNFGLRVKDNRLKLGLSREKLAEMINRSDNYLFSLERGYTSCSVHTLHLLHEALKVPADDLLYGEKVKEKDYTDKEILLNIINRCNEKELKVIKDVIIAMYPNFKDIIK